MRMTMTKKKYIIPSDEWINNKDWKYAFRAK